MDLGTIEQLVAGLSIIASGIHQVHRFSQKIGEINTKLDIILQDLDEFPELKERMVIMRTRQDALHKEIEALKKYN